MTKTFHHRNTNYVLQLFTTETYYEVNKLSSFPETVGDERDRI